MPSLCENKQGPQICLSHVLLGQHKSRFCFLTHLGIFHPGELTIHMCLVCFPMGPITTQCLPQCQLDPMDILFCDLSQVSCLLDQELLCPTRCPVASWELQPHPGGLGSQEHPSDAQETYLKAQDPEASFI